MASNPSSGTSTPNSRFTSQQKTAEDILSNHTVGLVNLSDFRKRRAEAIEQKERDAHDAILSGRVTPSSDGASTPSEPALKAKRKKRKIGTPKLSFGMDDGEGDGDDADGAGESADASARQTPVSSRGGTPIEGAQRKGEEDEEDSNKQKSKMFEKKKMGANANVGIAPKALTKSALLREAQTRESLRKQFLQIQEWVKATDFDIPFVFYDGTNIPGGICRVKKGDFIWVFLDRSRKKGAELGVGEKVNSRREWARIGVDDLMLVRGSIIIPHHYDFYYFIINHTHGPNNRLLFDYNSEPPATGTYTPGTAADSSIPENFNPLSRPSKSITNKDDAKKAEVEGTSDDPTYTKVVDRRWYERNKHIFPASVWQEFDPEKDYQKEVKRDQGGNAFFFS